MKKILLLALTFLSLEATDLDSLLSEYKTESDLSKKTKDESAGNLIVYTRDDLERMQVEYLKDILKSLRAFSYNENRLAQPDLINQDPIVYYSKNIRVYLNENELLTPLTGSGFIIFGDMEMDMIDHVEIYEGFPSFEFGAEPATIVIRLYTKSVEHDEGGRVKASIGSYQSNKQNVYYAGQEENFSYFVYVNHDDKNRNKYEKDANTLRRDDDRKRFYASLSTQNHRVEFHALKQDGDAFLSSLVGAVPDSAEKELRYFNVATHSEFLDKSLILNLSYLEESNNLASSYDANNPVILPGLPPVTQYDQDIEMKGFTASLQKKYTIQSHNIVAGLQYRYKYFDLKDIKFNNTAFPVSQAYDREDIYSISLQDSIALADNHLLTISVGDQYYKRNKNQSDTNLIQLRLGYTYTSQEWVAKTFLSRQEFAAEPYMLVSPYYGNTDLKSDGYSSIFQEVSYKTPSTLSKIVLGYGVNNDLAVIDNTFTLQNSGVDIYGYSGALEFTLFFRDNDKLELQANYTNIQSPVTLKHHGRYDYVARMLNSVSRFDIFNELVVHSNYRNVDDGYDYSVGVKYNASNDLKINLKGENIFDTGMKQIFYTKLAPTPETISVPIVDRKITFSFEYLF